MLTNVNNSIPVARKDRSDKALEANPKGAINISVDFYAFRPDEFGPAIETRKDDAIEPEQESNRLRLKLSPEPMSDLVSEAGYFSRSAAHCRSSPSPKRRACRGHIKDSLTLDERSWECPACGTTLDRDANAAINIKAAGLAVLACGENVSLVS